MAVLISLDMIDQLLTVLQLHCGEHIAKIFNDTVVEMLIMKLTPRQLVNAEYDNPKIFNAIQAAFNFISETYPETEPVLNSPLVPILMNTLINVTGNTSTVPTIDIRRQLEVQVEQARQADKSRKRVVTDKSVKTSVNKSSENTKPTDKQPAVKKDRTKALPTVDVDPRILRSISEDLLSSSSFLNKQHVPTMTCENFPERCLFCYQLSHSTHLSLCNEVHPNTDKCHSSGWYPHLSPTIWRNLYRFHQTGAPLKVKSPYTYDGAKTNGPVLTRYMHTASDFKFYQPTEDPPVETQRKKRSRSKSPGVYEPKSPAYGDWNTEDDDTPAPIPIEDMLKGVAH